MLFFFGANIKGDSRVCSVARISKVILVYAALRESKVILAYAALHESSDPGMVY